MSKFVSTLIVGGSLVISLTLAILWCFWWLYCAVMPQLWTDGPPNLIAPSYWLFVGAWVLLGFIGNEIFGRSKK